MTPGKFKKEMTIYQRENTKMSPFSVCCKEKWWCLLFLKITVSFGTQNSSELVTSRDWQIAAIIFGRELVGSVSEEKTLESLRSTTRRQRQRHKFCIFNEAKYRASHALHAPFSFLYISFMFSASLRREMTISQVLQRTWTHSRQFEFSSLAFTPHL